MFRALPLVDEANLEAYQEAIELFRQKADDSAGLAFTSSWGEANPGGGKDRVAAYLDRTQIYVVDVEKSLKLVLKYLDLKSNNLDDKMLQHFRILAAQSKTMVVLLLFLQWLV